MKPYEEARDEAAENYATIDRTVDDTIGTEIDAFKAGSTFGKSFSDKQHEAEITELKDKLSMMDQTDLQYRDHQRKSIMDAYKEKDAAIEKLIAQDSIIAKMEEALNIIVTEYNKPPYTELDWHAWKQRAESALTALKEFRDNK